MRVMGFVAAVLVGLGVWSAPAKAAVNIQVDLSTQTMHVRSGDGQAYDWPVSTARAGYVTPNGHYGVQSLQAMHYSHKYHNSPMPHSIFFKGGYAIHGTYATGSLGAAASHGCVRLSPAHAAQLYGMVRAEGASISITGATPGRGTVQVARRRSAAPVAVAYNDEGRPVVTRHGHHSDRDYALRLHSDVPALGYAPVVQAPSYGNWLENPFGAVLSGE
jgi:hypothetical protein